MLIPAVKDGARSTCDGLQVQCFLICGRFIDLSAADSKDFFGQLPQSFITFCHSFPSSGKFLIFNWINTTRIQSNYTPFDSSLNALSKVILVQVDRSSRWVEKSRKAFGAKRWRWLILQFAAGRSGLQSWAQNKSFRAFRELRIGESNLWRKVRGSRQRAVTCATHLCVLWKRPECCSHFHHFSAELTWNNQVQCDL